ncbi:MAG TPA: sigma-70 family RNA polymerase sigma factor [Bryobacteraceae bacterium]|nr:sigma-70 family RNA polymerase sigma factor [Bryobacteraceae bacterium]
MPSDSFREELVYIRSERGGVSLQDEVGQLFEETRDDVYRYLLTLGLHPPQAQETTQEVFLRLYVALKRKQEEIRNRRAWIFRVAHNLGLKTRAQQTAQPFDPELEAQLMDPERNPEQGLLDRERMGQFHRAMEGLSEQQKRCLFLRLEGLRYPEIGETLGISASAVGEFLRRAMNRLKKVGHE